jgi:DNA polymerase III subunit delta'
MHAMEWNVRGHEWAAHLLQEHIARQQVRHAYLLCGPAGVGRRSLALRFAQALCCSQPPAPGQPCGVCRACTQIERMQQADLTVIQSEEGSSVIKIEQIRDLQRQLSLSPYEAPYRIALLLNFQEANLNAQNALLKTLEEAPAKAILLLTADSPESLLPTIVSRCETLLLRPLPIDTLSGELIQRGLPADQADLLAHLTTGRLGYALRMSQNPELLEQRQKWLEDLQRLLSAPIRTRFSLVEPYCKNKDGLRQIFQFWLNYWRDAAVCAAGAEIPLVNVDCAQELARLSVKVGLGKLSQVVASLEQSLDHLENNANLRLLAEVQMLDWPRVKDD